MDSGVSQSTTMVQAEIAAAVEWIAMTFDRHSDAPLGTNCNKFGDLLTFYHQVEFLISSVIKFMTKYVKNMTFSSASAKLCVCKS